MHARIASGDFILPMMREAMNAIIADNTHLTARCEAMLEALNSDVAKSLEPTFDELNPPPEPRKEYRYHLGDTVYIGTQEYELLSFDEKKVVLFDAQFPLFNKELTREEFDNRLKENPLNDRLLQVVEELPVADNTKARISLDTGSNKVHWIYFNPDADAGGQYVSGDLDFSVFEELVEQYDIASHPENAADFRNDLEEISDQFLADINTPFFMEAENDYEMDCDYIEFTPENLLKIHEDILSLEADREAARETDRYEAEFGADGTRVFRETEDLAEDDSEIESLTDEELDALPISTVKDGEVVTYPNAEALLDDQKESLTPPPQVKRSSGVAPHVLHPEINTEYRTNFQIESDDIGVGTPLERFYHNIRAIQLLNKLDAESRLATPTEQRVLADYVGWGGLSEFFKEDNPHYTELKNVLSDEEYASARESTLTAFYTPPVVIKAVYSALENMHFQTGNVLEPSCGIGNFMGLVPESMNDAKFYGVELDSISGRIAQQLYQKNSIAVQGFENTNLPDSFFDAAIGNVPFGQFKVPDKRYDKHNFLIHDYFFARTLDKVRPGGVIAFITSKGTLDKENPNVRKYIAQRADLLGAIRLPNDTFKAAAGTEVTSDIIFLQKRDRLVDIEPDWVHLATDANGIRMNAYFVDNPEMVLGDMQMVSGPHGMESACIAYENTELGDLLRDAIQNIHAEITEYEIDDLEAEDESLSIPADPDVRNFSFTVVDGKIYYRENSRMNPVDVSTTAENRIKGMIAIRDCVRTLIEYQTEDYPDADIKAEQEKLNRLYDDFSKKYGLISARANNSAFNSDSSYCLLASLEVLDDEGNFLRKADMFSKRTIKQKVTVQSVDTASEAYALSLAEKARIDMPYMSQLTGKTEQELFEDLKGVIFLNPMHISEEDGKPKYLPADEYLSGNVREKLRWAKRSAELYPEDYGENIRALEAVQPVDLTASEISVRLGATWLPPEIIEEFMFELFSTSRYCQWNIHVHYAQYTGEWNVEGKSYDRSNVKAHNTYGTDRVNGYKIMEEKPKHNQSELKRCQKRYDELSTLIRGLYENLISGLLPERQYKQLMKQYDDEQAELEAKMETMKKELSEEKDSTMDIQHFILLIRKYKNPTEVSDLMFTELIDKIVVYEAEGVGKAKTQKVDIYFNYVGQVDIAYTEEELAEIKEQEEQEEKKRLEKQRQREKAYREKRKAKKLAENGGEIVKTKVCPHCGKEFTPTSNRQIFCSKDCCYQARQDKTKADREAEKGSHYYRQRVCAVCGSTYWPTHSQQKFCSEECKKVNHNKKSI
ncbi:MAG: DUF4368 domain-containing protein [Oscillospiraceae bacterium]